MNWESLYASIKQCQKCALGSTRTNAVPGEGNRQADLMFVGEGPGAQEDERGRPFVGAAGMLLDKMIAAIGMSRQDVYIANIVKCRPPRNRVPSDEEAFACLPYLRTQTAYIRPKIIVCLGATAARYIIDPSVRITRDRGQWVERKGFWLIATYHPAALLRDPSKKKEAWEDFQKIRDKLKETEDGSGGEVKDKFTELKNRAETEIKKSLGGIVVFGEGNLQADVMLIGEAPGQEETLQKRPFVGRAGKNLDEFLMLCQLKREQLYVSNVVKVRPAKTGASGRLSNRPPNRHEIEVCLLFLWEEIYFVQPKTIVTLGNTALRALCGEQCTIGAMHGVLTESKWSVFPLYHPASIIYNRSLYTVYQQDILKLSQLVTG